MAIPALITHTGMLNGSPAASAGTPCLQEILNTSFSATYQSSKSGRPGIVNATDLSPFVIPFETIVKVRAMAIKVVGGGSVRVKVSTAFGTDQVIPVSGILLWHCPNAGDEITSIKLIGTADIEYVIAGDLA